jgi:hypothetical protein
MIGGVGSVVYNIIETIHEIESVAFLDCNKIGFALNVVRDDPEPKLLCAQNVKPRYNGNTTIEKNKQFDRRPGKRIGLIQKNIERQHGRGIRGFKKKSPLIRQHIKIELFGDPNIAACTTTITRTN